MAGSWESSGETLVLSGLTCLPPSGTCVTKLLVPFYCFSLFHDLEALGFVTSHDYVPLARDLCCSCYPHA